MSSVYTMFTQYCTFLCILYSSVCSVLCRQMLHDLHITQSHYSTRLSISIILTACRILDIAVSRITVHLQIKPIEFTSFFQSRSCEDVSPHFMRKVRGYIHRFFLIQTFQKRILLSRSEFHMKLN